MTNSLILLFTLLFFIILKIFQDDINLDHKIEVSNDPVEENNLLRKMYTNKAVIKGLIFCFITSYALWATIYYVKNAGK